MKKILVTALVLLTGCAEAPPRRIVYVAQPVLPVQVYAPAPQAAVGMYEEPALEQPEPIAVHWAPPPMLVEMPPPAPYDGAVWIGGYWIWSGNWIWAHGRWADVPRPHYYWVHPYYEHRDNAVVFISGYWSAPTVVFVAPPPSMHIEFAVVSSGVRPGPAPIGPAGVFIPAPPGSRPGIIIPAPIGTSPAVVTSAPPVVNVGMRIQSNVNSNNTTNVTNINNVRNITNITNVTIVAPASATASGQAFHTSVPAQAHLAAAMHSVVNAPAPRPGPVQAMARSGAGGTAAQATHYEVAPSPVRAALPTPLPRPGAQAPELVATARPTVHTEAPIWNPAQLDQSLRTGHGSSTTGTDKHVVNDLHQRTAAPAPRPVPKPIKQPAKEGQKKEKKSGIDKKEVDNR